MIRRIAVLSLTAAMAVLALSTAAAKDKITKPKSNEVVLVLRLVIDPPINDAFYAHYAKVLEKGIANVKIKPDRDSKDEAPAHYFSLYLNKAGRNEIFQRGFSGGKVGEFNFLKRPIPKGRMLEISGMRAYIFGNPFLRFDIPVFHNISIPEGANYIYLGTFVVKTKDEYFNISEISRIDEYDAAAKVIENNYGKDAKLVRVNLLELPDKK
jgi:hypothetical protein